MPSRPGINRTAAGTLRVAASERGVTLNLYGTGIRNARTVTAKLGVQSVAVVAAGPYPGSPGLDSVELQIPPELANRGIAALQLTADGVPSNSVTVSTLHYQGANMPVGWSRFGLAQVFVRFESSRIFTNFHERDRNAVARVRWQWRNGPARVRQREAVLRGHFGAPKGSAFFAPPGCREFQSPESNYCFRRQRFRERTHLA